MFENVKVKRDLIEKSRHRPTLKQKRGSKYTNLISSRNSGRPKNSRLGQQNSLSSSRPTPI